MLSTLLEKAFPNNMLTTFKTFSKQSHVTLCALCTPFWPLPVPMDQAPWGQELLVQNPWFSARMEATPITDTAIY